jgi:hypothetical protein
MSRDGHGGAGGAGRAGGAQPSPGAGAHEASDINARAILLFLGALAVVALVIQVALVGLFGYLAMRESRRDAAAGRAAPEVALPAPAPRLQVRPRDDLAALRAEEELLLGHYGWVDPDLGVVRIPIERAIDILAERGLPARAGGDAIVAAEARSAPRDAASGRSLEESR